MNSKLPSNLKSTLMDLESTLLEWGRYEMEGTDTLASENSSEAESAVPEKTSHEKELQKKAKDLLYKLKSQIDDLS